MWYLWEGKIATDMQDGSHRIQFFVAAESLRDATGMAEDYLGEFDKEVYIDARVVELTCIGHLARRPEAE